MRSSAWIPLRACIFICCVCCVCCVGSGLCDELITRSEESYRVCVCVCVCVSNCVWPRNLNNEAAYARVWLLRHKKKSAETYHLQLYNAKQYNTISANTNLLVIWHGSTSFPQRSQVLQQSVIGCLLHDTLPLGTERAGNGRLHNYDRMPQEHSH